MSLVTYVSESPVPISRKWGTKAGVGVNVNIQVTTKTRLNCVPRKGRKTFVVNEIHRSVDVAHNHTTAYRIKQWR